MNVSRTLAAASSTLAVALALAARPAHAQPARASGISVSAQGCEFQIPELQRLVRLELSTVLEASDAPSAYTVSLVCEKGSVRVTLRDPLTEKTLERTVVAPPSGSEEPERLMALTIAQLYRASWLELDEAEPEPERVPLPPKTRPRRSPAEVRSAKRLVAKAERESEPRSSLGLELGPRVRRLQAPILLPSIEALFTWSPATRLFWISVTAGAEYGVLDRSTGSLEITVGKALVGGAIEPLVRGRWSGFAELAVGAAIVHIAAESVEPGYYAAALTGVGFEGTAGFGAAIRVGPLRFELVLRAGVLYGSPRAIIAGDEDLVLDGAWLGSDARARWQF